MTGRLAHIYLTHVLYPTHILILLCRHHIQAVAEALVRRDSPLEGGGRVLGGGGGGAKPVTFQDFLRYTFYANTYNGTWHSDSEVRFLDSVGILLKHFFSAFLSFAGGQLGSV